MLGLIAVVGLVAGSLGTADGPSLAPTPDDVAAATPPTPGPATAPATPADPSTSPDVPTGSASELADSVTCTTSAEVEPVPCPWWTTELPGTPATGAEVVGATAAVAIPPQLVGLDTRNGQRRWSTPAGPVTGVAASADDDGFVVWNAQGELFFVDDERGSIAWRAPEPVDVVDAAADQGWVVAATATDVRGWPFDGSAEGWRVPVSGQPSPLAVGDGVVVVGDGNGEVRYIDVDTGTVRWTAGTDTWFTAVTPDSSLIVTTGFGSPMLALDPHEGETVWEAPSVVGWAVPHVVPGTRAVGARHVVAQEGENGALSIVDLATGGLVLELPSPGRVLGTTVDGWVLVFGDGSIEAYDGQRADGSAPWAVHLGGEPVGAPAVAYPRSPEAPLLLVVTADGRVVATPIPTRAP